MFIDDTIHRYEHEREPPGGHATRLRLMRGHGRHAGTDLPAGTVALLVTLTGRLELESPEARWELPRRSVLLWRDGPLRIVSHVPCRWLMLHGGQDAWKPHVRSKPGQPQLTLFPMESTCPLDLARAMLHVGRAMQPAATRGRLGSAADAIADLCAVLDEHQAWLLPMLQRCSGRTLHHRQRTLLRLMRVRDLIRRSGDGRTDLNRLAEYANYSPCHLLRIYRDAFGETPNEYATSLRHQRAWELVRGTRMQVYEITEMLGFESQSSFCRAFKSAFGATTSEVRRRHAESELPACSRTQARVA